MVYDLLKQKGLQCGFKGGEYIVFPLIDRGRLLQTLSAEGTNPLSPKGTVLSSAAKRQFALTPNGQYFVTVVTHILFCAF